MNDSLQAQQAAYEIFKRFCYCIRCSFNAYDLFSLWICLKGIVAPMHYISQTLQKMVADIVKKSGRSFCKIKDFRKR